MNLVVAGVGAVWKADCPWKVCWFSEAAAFEVTADFAETESNQQRDGDNIKPAAYRKPVTLQKYNNGCHGKDEATEKFEASLPDSKDGK